MLISTFFHEIIQYLLKAFLLYHFLIFTFSVSKSTVARSMVSAYCRICPLTHHWFEWLNVALLHKDHLFRQLHSTNLLHFWIHKLVIHSLESKHWNRMDVFHYKRNKFVQTVLCSQQVLVALDLGTQQRRIRWKQRRCCWGFFYGLISFIVLLQLIY